MSKPIAPEKRTPKCAQCNKKPVSPEYRPFCSKRCADIDLGQWLKGGYAIPGAPAELDENARDTTPPDDNADDD